MLKQTKMIRQGTVMKKKRNRKKMTGWTQRKMGRRRSNWRRGEIPMSQRKLRKS
jgi:hypothetical protein